MEPRIRTPDVLDTKKYRAKYRGHNLHMAVSDDDDGNIVETQITICDLNPVTQDFSYANADMIQGLINAILQHDDPYSIEYLLELIGKNSRSKADLPGKIVEILTKHLVNNEKSSDNT